MHLPENKTDIQTGRLFNQTACAGKQAILRIIQTLQPVKLIYLLSSVDLNNQSCNLLEDAVTDLRDDLSFHTRHADCQGDGAYDCTDKTYFCCG